jgi:DNA repair protein RecO
MEILKTTGIALSSQVSGEADIICNYYTRDFGKRKFIFKGLKKSKKRSLSATEPGSVASVVYNFREGRDAYIVNDVSLEKYYSSITGDIRKIFHLYFILESVEKTSGYDMADEGIFNLLRAAIDALSKTDFPAHLSSFFIIHLLKEHGVLSDIDSCKICSRKTFRDFSLDVADLRPICSSCIIEHPSGPWQRCSLLAEEMRDFMRDCIARKFSTVDNARFSESDVLDLLFNLSLFMEHYFHTELKSKSFIFSGRFR